MSSELRARVRALEATESSASRGLSRQKIPQTKSAQIMQSGIEILACFAMFAISVSLILFVLFRPQWLPSWPSSLGGSASYIPCSRRVAILPRSILPYKLTSDPAYFALCITEHGSRTEDQGGKMHRFRVEAFTHQGGRSSAAFGIAVHEPGTEGREEQGHQAWKSFRRQVAQGLKLREAAWPPALPGDSGAAPGPAPWQLFSNSGKLLDSLQVILPGLAVLSMDGKWLQQVSPKGDRPLPRASSRGRKRAQRKTQRREQPRGLRTALAQEARQRTTTRKSRSSARHSRLGGKMPSGREARGTSTHHQTHQAQSAQPGGG